MNEREFLEFYRYLAAQVDPTKQDNEELDFDLKAKFDQEFMIDIMWKILGRIDERGHAMTRVSMHAINFHLLCFDRSIWRSGKLSVISSIEVSLKIAGGYSSQNFSTIMEKLDTLRFNLPENITINTKLGELVKSREELIKEPVFSFQYGSLQ